MSKAMNPLSVACLLVCLHYHDPAIARDIEKLGHPLFAHREQAHRMLCARGWQAMYLLLKAREHKDAEIARRAELLSVNYLIWHYCPLPDGREWLPWVDMLDISRYRKMTAPAPDYDGSVGSASDVVYRCLAVANESEHILPPGADYPRFRLATAVLVDELFGAGWSRDRIVRLLNYMQAREEDYRKHYGS